MAIPDATLQRIIETLDILTERFARLDERSKYANEKHERLAIQVDIVDKKTNDNKERLTEIASQLEQVEKETKGLDKLKTDIISINRDRKNIKHTAGKVFDIILKIAMAVTITYLTIRLSLSDESDRPTISDSQGID